MKNLLLLFFALPLISFSQCPPTGGVFTSQAQIDALSIDYPNCTEVDSFSISGDDITDLSGLFQINSCTSFSISNNLILENTIGLNPNIIIRFVEGTGTSFSIHNNAALLTINGLENFESQSGFESSFTISDNPMLVSLQGLPNQFGPLTWFSIVNNDSLINLNGIEDYCAGETTTISDNDSLVDLTGLYCASGSENVRISNNNSLISFNGLNQLWIGYDLYIENNAVLEDINIASGNGIGFSPNIIIRNNPNLSVCTANWLCDYLYSEGIEEGIWFPGVFENNAPGCNSNIEVEYGCELNSNDDCGYPGASSYSFNQLVLGETITANNEFATTSNYTPTCNDIANRKDVWFAFDSGDNNTIDIVIDTGFYLQLWEGYCMYDLTSVENACGTQLIDFPVTPNTAYLIQVWNDDPADRIVGSSWFDLTVQDGTLSTEDIKLKTVKVYPNPVKDILNIETTTTIEKVEIFSLFGQKLNSFNSNAIDMSTYSSGIYIIKVISDGNETVYKLIKD